MNNKTMNAIREVLKNNSFRSEDDLLIDIVKVLFENKVIKNESEIVNMLKCKMILATVDNFNYRKEINEQDTAIEDNILIDTLNIILNASIL